MEKPFMNKPYDELMKENEVLKMQNEAYKIQLDDLLIDCEKWMGLYAHKSKQYDMLDPEKDLKNIIKEIIDEKFGDINKPELIANLNDANTELRLTRSKYYNACRSSVELHREKQSLDQEFEEAVRGDLMNLKLVKKYLDKVRPTAKTKDEYLKAMNIVDTDISNLDKFVEERWGHGQAE